jgi:hypothetical protein
MPGGGFSSRLHDQPHDRSNPAKILTFAVVILPRRIPGLVDPQITKQSIQRLMKNTAKTRG